MILNWIFQEIKWGSVLDSFGPGGQVAVWKRVITELLRGGVVLLRYQEAPAI
jgi:hypothetical protein